MYLKAPIGAFADIVFEVSSERVFTYDDYQRNSKSRFAKHELINQATVVEWLGRELEEITFNMKFSVTLGVNPKEEANRVRELCHDGVADYLILGNEVIGDNLWVIETLSEKATAWDNAGNILFSELSVKMLEYVPRLEET